MLTGADIEAARADLRRIQAAFRQFINLHSNWNGDVTVAPLTSGLNGMKDFGCAIALSADVLRDQGALRWRVLIHEFLHSLSAGYSPLHYESQKRWEEGVVEQLQRLFRRRILQALGIDLSQPSFSEEAFEELDMLSLHNTAVSYVDGFREQLGMLPEDFYVWLLRTPLGERAYTVITSTRQRPQEP